MKQKKVSPMSKIKNLLAEVKRLEEELAKEHLKTIQDHLDDYIDNKLVELEDRMDDFVSCEHS